MSAAFKGRHFAPDIILLCMRWYCRYALSCRDLKEMMAERGLSVDHTTIYRWVQHYAPELDPRVQWCRDRNSRSWYVDGLRCKPLSGMRASFHRQRWGRLQA